ncbi:hypothetical protein WAI453_011993 [Rhynchosporium graminicola]
MIPQTPTTSESPAVAMLSAFTPFQNLPQELRDQIWEAALPGSRIVHLEWKLLDVDHNERDKRKTKMFRALRDLDRIEEVEKYPLAKDERQIEEESEDLDEDSEDDSDYEYIDPANFPPRLFGFSSPSNRALLPFLHCTKDSRNAVYRRYSKTFSSRFHPGETFFDFKRDTLYLDWGLIPNSFNSDKCFTPEDFRPCEAGKVRHLALNDGIEMQTPARMNSLDGMERHFYRRWLDRNILPVFRNLTSLDIVDKQHGDSDPDCSDLVSMNGIVDIANAMQCYLHEDVTRRHAFLNHIVEDYNDNLRNWAFNSAPVPLSREGTMRNEMESHAEYLRDCVDNAALAGLSGPGEQAVQRSDIKLLAPSIPFRRPRCFYTTYTTRQHYTDFERARRYFIRSKEGWRIEAQFRFLEGNCLLFRTMADAYIPLHMLVEGCRLFWQIPKPLKLVDDSRWAHYRHPTCYDTGVDRDCVMVFNVVIDRDQPG